MAKISYLSLCNIHRSLLKAFRSADNQDQVLPASADTIFISPFLLDSGWTVAEVVERMADDIQKRRR